MGTPASTGPTVAWVEATGDVVADDGDEDAPADSVILDIAGVPARAIMAGNAQFPTAEVIFATDSRAWTVAVLARADGDTDAAGLAAALGQQARQLAALLVEPEAESPAVADPTPTETMPTASPSPTPAITTLPGPDRSAFIAVDPALFALDHLGTDSPIGSWPHVDVSFGSPSGNIGCSILGPEQNDLWGCAIDEHYWEFPRDSPDDYCFGRRRPAGEVSKRPASVFRIPETAAIPDSLERSLPADRRASSAPSSTANRSRSTR